MDVCVSWKILGRILSRQMTCLCSHRRGVRCEEGGAWLSGHMGPGQSLEAGGTGSPLFSFLWSSGQHPSQLTPWERSQAQRPWVYLALCFYALGLSSERSVDVQTGIDP